MKTRAPAISVMMPFYNAEDSLAECLGSLLAQDFTDFELVAVNDQSPRPFVLNYVNNHGAREKIAAILESMGYRVGHDYLSVG